MLFPKTGLGELWGQLWRTRRNTEVPHGINRPGESTFQFNILPRKEISFHCRKAIAEQVDLNILCIKTVATRTGSGCAMHEG